MSEFIKLVAALAVVSISHQALAQTTEPEDLLAGKPIFTLGEAKTWTSNENDTYTFNTEDLQKLVAVPTNTSNVFLFPETNGEWNNPEDREIGIQGFYIDMERTRTVGIVTTTWEGAAADAYDIYLTDTKPTLDILNTTPVYSAEGLGQYTENMAVLPDNSRGRYLVFQPTNATNWGWGVKIRSISAIGPIDDMLTSFSVSPSIIALNKPTAVQYAFKNQIGMDIDPSNVEVSMSDNATFEDGFLTITSGTEAILTATMDDTSIQATVYAAIAPPLPQAASIKTPVYTNTITDDNSGAQWTVDYNGGAINSGAITFENGEVAHVFGDVRCIFFNNSNTTGGWNTNQNPADQGWSSLCLDIFASKNAEGKVVLEQAQIIPVNNPFTLEAGKWNHIEVDLVNDDGEICPDFSNMSIRFDEENMCDILLANIYFTPLYIEGDEVPPVLSSIEASPARTSVMLSFSATDDMNPDVHYSISNGTTTVNMTAPSGERVEYVFKNLESSTEYTFSVTASDGKNTSAPQEITVKTLGFPSAPTPEIDGNKVVALYSDTYGITDIPRFDNWGSNAQASTINTENGTVALLFTDYLGQWGGLVNLNIDLQGADTLHLDIYSDEAGSITIAPVWGDATGDTPNKTINFDGGNWNSLVLPLSDFGHPGFGDKIIQFAMNGSTVSTFALDNIFFYNPQGLSGIGSVAAENAPAEFFTLQGARVQGRPDAGIYIRRCGSKVEKVVVK